jgi:YidC/Oxa1 family membrane protein insertase
MDRRVIWAIALMMIIAIAPSFFLKPPKKADRRTGGPADSVQVAADSQAGPLVESPSRPLADARGKLAAEPSRQQAAETAETVTVSSPLYRYDISTRGGAIVQAYLQRYLALNPEDRKQRVRLLHEDAPIHRLAVTVGADTIRLADWDFVPSARRLEVSAPAELALRAQRGGIAIELTYRFRPDDYQIGVTGVITGLGPVGGHLLVGMGDGLRQTESDSAGNYYAYAIVTKTTESTSHPFSKFKAGQRESLDGPFEWAAVKSKYFVTALLAIDSASSPISGVRAEPRPDPGRKDITRVTATFGVALPPTGTFAYRLYAGAMEYPRLRAIGHDFYDINPYGWPGFRTMIRPIAVGARWLLVWMHEQLSLAYGTVLVLFGVMIRIVLWPLNQKGMRASIRMQALQPEMQRIQEKYKDNPQRLQQEMMGLYKREGVNPFSGCWPMLLPWPVLLALFFVLSNTIELRGQSYLWLPDLSLKDPIYVIPVLMGASMFAVTKVGMRGVPPSPQSKMMLYFMPLMMTVLFLNFASGLNLYYFVQNVVSIPQQWLLARERLRAKGEVGTAAVVERKRQK